MAPREKEKNRDGKRSLRGFEENRENGKNKKRKKNRGLRTSEVLRERLRKQEVESKKVKLAYEPILA